MKFPFSIHVNKFIFINGKDSSYYFLHTLKSGADQLEHATPILSLCHGIFTD